MPNILEKDLAAIYFFVRTCFGVEAMWTSDLITYIGIKLLSRVFDLCTSKKGYSEDKGIAQIHLMWCQEKVFLDWINFKKL